VTRNGLHSVINSETISFMRFKLCKFVITSRKNSTNSKWTLDGADEMKAPN